MEDNSRLNFIGTEFFLDGQPVDGLEINQALVIADRDVVLSGRLADGNEFSMPLSSSPNFTSDSSTDARFDISETAIITVTLATVPEPSTAAIALLSTVGLFVVMSRSRRHKLVRQSCMALAVTAGCPGQAEVETPLR